MTWVTLVLAFLLGFTVCVAILGIIVAYDMSK